MSDLIPPRPTAQPVERTIWGETVIDDYAWLRDAKDPEVLAHLKAENAYSDALLSSTADLQASIFDEIKSRVQETDLSVPVEKDGWSYYSRSQEGLPYGIHCRRRIVGIEGKVSDHGNSTASVAKPGTGSLEGEQVFFDENIEAGRGDQEEAADAGYFEIGVFEVSPDHRLLLWGEDRDGEEVFSVRVRDLETGIDLKDRLVGCAAGSAWAMDNKTFFYLRLDEAHRPYQVWRHELGTDQQDDDLVFEELDERFWCGVGRDRDDSFIHVGASSTLSDETWLIPGDDPTAAPVCVQHRAEKLEYGVAHHIDKFVVLTNDSAENFRIATMPDAIVGDGQTRAQWDPLIPPRSDVMITGFEILRDYLIVFERTAAITRFSFARWDELSSDPQANLAALTVIEQDEDVYSVWPGANPSPDTTLFRFGYTSMVTPASLFTIDLANGDRVLLKQQEVQGDFEVDHYTTWREWVASADGTKVPVTLVAHKDRAEIVGGAGGPVVLGAYGAYEVSQDPSFSVARLSLLDRGFVVGLVHARGGGELGRRWYEQGKFEHKANTFADVVAAGEHMVSSGLADKDRLALRGGSAGGLMAGAVMNSAPELFVAVAAQVPFVDIVNTMLDPSLPLTVGEWEEWGNPAESELIYNAMRSYAPLENVHEAKYPAVFATAGLNDPRVGFWEPAKWVLALRSKSTSGRPVLLRTEMDAGHGGMTGRYEEWRDEARTLAFLVEYTADSQGLARPEPDQ